VASWLQTPAGEVCLNSSVQWKGKKFNHKKGNINGEEEDRGEGTMGKGRPTGTIRRSKKDRENCSTTRKHVHSSSFCSGVAHINQGKSSWRLWGEQHVVAICCKAQISNLHHFLVNSTHDDKT